MAGLFDITRAIIDLTEAFESAGLERPSIVLGAEKDKILLAGLAKRYLAKGPRSSDAPDVMNIAGVKVLPYHYG